MTTEELVKALECCKHNAGNCPDHCPLRYDVECTNTIASNALDLINRQKAEIEELREIVFMDRTEAIKRLKAEAVKEFAERLKEECGNVARMEFGGFTYFCVGFEFFDNLVKEFTEGEDD